MSFLKKLFGGGNGGEPGAPRVLDTQEYKDFKIRAIEMKAGSEFQLCGEIEKEIDGETKVHQFIRADRLSSADQAAETALSKARQIIDEQGDRLFS